MSAAPECKYYSSWITQFERCSNENNRTTVICWRRWCVCLYMSYGNVKLVRASGKIPFVAMETVITHRIRILITWNILNKRKFNFQYLLQQYSKILESNTISNIKTFHCRQRSAPLIQYHNRCKTSMWTERYTTGALISVIANTLHTHMYHIYINPIALLSPQSVVIRSANHSESAVWHISAGEFPARALCELWTLCQFYFPSPHNNTHPEACAIVFVLICSTLNPWIQTVSI